MNELKALALNNDTLLEEYCNNIFISDSLSKQKKEIYKLFIDTIDLKKKIGINVDLESLWKILQTGKYLNIFEIGYSEHEILERYNKTGPYYNKLNRFTSKFDPELKIKYAALNIGNLGTKYKQFGNGEICIILKDAFLTQIENLVCLKYFSLKYFKDNDDFDEINFKKDIGFWNQVNALALDKHMDDIDLNNLEHWPDIITTSSKGWLEILISEIISVSSFESIRFRKRTYDHLHSLILKDEAELELIDIIYKKQFVYMEKFCSQNNINIEKF